MTETTTTAGSGGNTTQIMPTPTRHDVPLTRAQKAAMNLTPRVRLHPKIGRNAPCPCGRGAKFKKCCGRA